jgi:hypothetical protein
VSGTAGQFSSAIMARGGLGPGQPEFRKIILTGMSISSRLARLVGGAVDHRVPEWVPKEWHDTP